MEEQAYLEKLVYPFLALLSFWLEIFIDISQQHKALIKAEVFVHIFILIVHYITGIYLCKTRSSLYSNFRKNICLILGKFGIRLILLFFYLLNNTLHIIPRLLLIFLEIILHFLQVI